MTINHQCNDLQSNHYRRKYYSNGNYSHLMSPEPCEICHLLSSSFDDVICQYLTISLATRIQMLTYKKLGIQAPGRPWNLGLHKPQEIKIKLRIMSSASDKQYTIPGAEQSSKSTNSAAWGKELKKNMFCSKNSRCQDMRRLWRLARTSLLKQIRLCSRAHTRSHTHTQS